MKVVPVPQLMDNYAYLVIDEPTRRAGIVDCAEAEPVLEAVKQERVELTAVLPTHHHYDHVGGNEALLAAHRTLSGERGNMNGSWMRLISFGRSMPWKKRSSGERFAVDTGKSVAVPGRQVMMLRG